MKSVPLATVRHRVVLGAHLPFNVYAADGALLRARGLVNLEEISDEVDAAGLVAAIANRLRRRLDSPMPHDTQKPSTGIVSSLPVCDFAPTRAQALLALQAV
jgi:hypothetical protein